MRFHPSGEVRIVRTLTSQILDWKDRISENRKAWGHRFRYTLYDGLQLKGTAS